LGLELPKIVRGRKRQAVTVRQLEPTEEVDRFACAAVGGSTHCGSNRKAIPAEMPNYFISQDFNRMK
jgi:hypothetical protein